MNLPNHHQIVDMINFKGYYNDVSFNKYKQYASLVTSGDNFDIDDQHYTQMDPLDVESIFNPYLSLKFKLNATWIDFEDKLHVNYLWRAMTMQSS